ncbi:MAG: gliding motility-associated C-terminal domain-containing protein [Flavobacteriales bacterium]|nr:gliding motility-associated C-terminal domain-containing protein [Flavobacteriales bacterium]
MLLGLLREWIGMNAVFTCANGAAFQVRAGIERQRSSLGVVFMLVLFSGALNAQDIYPITEPSITACSGGLVTSQGLSGEGYLNDEDFTTTICPDPSQPGQAIFLTFVAFDLSMDGPAPVDQFLIYDGADITAPLIGTFTGEDLQGQIIAATPDNASGCLTLHFTSNSIGEGTFSAVIECGTPCWPPVPNAVITGESLPAKVCLDETIEFDATASQPHPGRTIVGYEWTMDDGTTLTGPVVSHAFDEAGQYLVSVKITDDVGCENTQQTSVAVWVGTEPHFMGTTPGGTACVGAPLELDGEAQAVTWSELPVVDLGGQIDLPDQVGQLFTSDLEFSIFPSNSVLIDPSDLTSLCVSMEHTFIGDFVLSITCPNGQNVVLHQQGGGGTFLGDANDTDSGSDIVPGTCWDYCFSSTATWGTWSESAQFGTTPHVTPVSQGTALMEGTYTPVDPFSDLVGCPLNGVWTLSYVDQWAADNGTMCNWSINFDPSLYPDLTEFTPHLGTSADSVHWSGYNIVADASDPSIATTVLDQAGVQQFIYSVTDDFGCTYDTTITFTVRNPPTVAAGITSAGQCEQPARLRALIVANALPAGSPPLLYSWTPAAGATNPGAPEPYTQITQPTLFHVTVQVNGQPWCTSTDSILVQPPSFLENDSSIVHVLCHGGEGSIAVDSEGPGGPWSYEWRNAQNAVVQNTASADGDELTAPAGSYSVIIRELASGNGCVDTVHAEITEPDALVWDITPRDSVICLTGTHTLSASTNGGTGNVVLSWDQGLSGSGPHIISPASTTSYAVVAEDANGCMTDTVVAAVTVREALSLTALEDLEYCHDVPFQLTVSGVSGGDGEHHYSWSNSPVDAASIVDSLQVDSTICVTLRDGCETPPVTSCTSISILRTPPLEVLIDSSLGCAPFATYFVLVDTAGGAFVQWDLGDGSIVEGPDSLAHVYPEAGWFDIATHVTWPNGCIADTVLTDAIRAIPLPVADFTWTTPLNIMEPVGHFTEAAGPWAVAYEWDFGQFGEFAGPSAEVTFPNDIGRAYPVQLVVSNILGCTDTLLRYVPVDDLFLVFIPNAFSPNGDGDNEMFGVSGNDIADEEFELLIFDRWGKSVFAATDPAVRWDGNADGTVLPAGVYTWRLNIRSEATLQKRILYGHVTLLR